MSLDVATKTNADKAAQQCVAYLRTSGPAKVQPSRRYSSRRRRYCAPAPLTVESSWRPCFDVNEALAANDEDVLILSEATSMDDVTAAFDARFPAGHAALTATVAQSDYYGRCDKYVSLYVLQEPRVRDQVTAETLADAAMRLGRVSLHNSDWAEQRDDIAEDDMLALLNNDCYVQFEGKYAVAVVHDPVKARRRLRRRMPGRVVKAPVCRRITRTYLSAATNSMNREMRSVTELPFDLPWVSETWRYSVLLSYFLTACERFAYFFGKESFRKVKHVQDVFRVYALDASGNAKMLKPVLGEYSRGGWDPQKVLAWFAAQSARKLPKPSGEFRMRKALNMAKLMP